MNKGYSLKESDFYERKLPKNTAVVGYSAIIYSLKLDLPYPDIICVVGKTSKKYETNEYRVFGKTYMPSDTLYNHLVFALKYEGINLLFFKKLFHKISKEEIIDILQIEASGQYSRKIWFLYEYLTEIILPIADADTKIKYTPLVDEKIQYCIKNGIKQSRHKIINNLTGNINFCPLIRKTKKLEYYISSDYSNYQDAYINGIRKDILHRASAFLMLRDSKASFSIEGESPKNKRTTLWGKAIAQAGFKELSKAELIRLQHIVIENTRFIDMGFRKVGGFVGEHDRLTSEPIPEHISARWQDVEKLIDGLIETNDLLEKSEIDAVISATLISFGFIYIHPFVDGNGRIHRYLIHHLLARKKFSKQGFIFPVSASILNNIIDYRKILEKHSQEIINFIEWKPTNDNNIEVVNDTIDYYRYFDATAHAEFLYDCIDETIKKIIPEEIEYLKRYDEFKRIIESEYEMPDNLIALLVKFLEQNKGVISKRAREKELKELTDKEDLYIEKLYKEIFVNE